MLKRLLMAGILFAALIFSFAAGQSATPSSTPAGSPPQQPQANQPSGLLKTETRLVSVDVVATDSHGNIVRDLKPEDFTISDGGRQQIQKFAFIDKSPDSAAKPSSPAPAQAHPAGFYTNQTNVSDLAMPPTVILLDSLNTNAQDLQRFRRSMIGLLKSLPTDTPVAVFLLGESLQVVQDFSSDPAVLRAAVDKAMNPTVQQGPAPEDDPNSLSLAMLDANGGQEDNVIQALENFEMQTYANTMDIRVITTLDALTSIAHYLSSYEGRKNLVWISESFPIALVPDPDFGAGPGVTLSNGARAYGQQAQDAGNALADAHVAVYPVDARGLDTYQFYGASQRPPIRANNAARTTQAALRRENVARSLAHNTMQLMADSTGGKTCMTTNDLAGCVENALKESASYYELAYSPQNIKWNGNFRTISLKTTRPGVKLIYRRGYFADDPEKAASAQPPEKRLQTACSDLLPATSIAITAQAEASPHPNEARYLMSVPAAGLTIVPDGNNHKVSAMMATCVYAKDDEKFQFTSSDLSQTLSSDQYQTWQSTGLRGYVDVADNGPSRVRIAVLDLTSSSVGALDVLLPSGSPASKNALATASSPAGAPAAENSQPKIVTSIAFTGPSGQSGVLDWGGGKVVYQGILSPATTAPVFFAQFFAKDFHCDAGKLVPNAADGRQPSLTLTFTDSQGRVVKIDLAGDAPEYSGTLPIDDSAKSFFNHLLTLAHCQANP